MKNLTKINPEGILILSDREMKDIAGGTYYGDTCEEKNQCNGERCMSKTVRSGFCGNPTGIGRNCKCMEATIKPL